VIAVRGGPTPRRGSTPAPLPGVAYSYLALHRATRDRKWTDRAQIVARWAAADSSPHFLPNALYKGAIGIAVLAQDLEAPLKSTMPVLGA